MMFDPVSVLQQLIRIDTTNPPGNEGPAIHLLQGLVEEVGVSTTLLASDPARPNLIARIPGTGAAPPLLLQGHVDVVPTAGQAWTHDPFAGEIIDGYLWGRGTLDMKGAVVMMTHAFVTLARSGLRPQGDIILCILADEERNGTHGARFLVEEHPALFDGVAYAIGEFGGFPFDLGGTSFYPIQVAERMGVRFELVIRGDGGHGSMPKRGQASARLGRILTRLDRRRLPVHIVPATRMMVEGMVDHLDGVQRAALKSLLRPRTADLTLRALGSQLGTLEPLFRNTVSPTIVRGGHAHNVIPSEITLTLDGRMLPGSSVDEMTAELRSIVGSDVEITAHVDGAAPPAAPDLGLFPLLSEVITAAEPHAVPVPFLMPAVTDGRWFAQLGIQPYGFTPLPMDPEFEFQAVVHAADERVPVAAIRRGAAIIYELVRRYPG